MNLDDVCKGTRYRGDMRLPRFFLPIAAFIIAAAVWLGYRSAQPSPVVPPPAQRNIPLESITYHGPALWRIHDADTVIYLFGTFHMLPPGSEDRWFKGPLRQAFDGSDTLVTEIITPANPMELAPATIALATDVDGPALTAKLPPAVRQDYKNFVEAQDLRPQSLDRFEPWYVASLLATTRYRKAGFDPRSGAERVLIASLGSKKHEALETPQAQLSMLDSVPENEQIDSLIQLVTSKSDVRASIAAMSGQWMNGNAEGLAASKNVALYKMEGMSRIMLFDRNRRWAAWLAKRLQTSGTVFVAVGASHLAGPRSVQHFLGTDHGIAAERVPN